MALFHQLRFRHIALIAILLLPCRLFAEVLIVTSAHAPAITISKDQLRELFTGKISQLPGALPPILIDLPESSPLREEFYDKVTQRSVAQERSIWARLYFTGRGTPPRVASDSDEVRKLINSMPGAIGYIERPSLDNSLRVIFETK